MNNHFNLVCSIIAFIIAFSIAATPPFFITQYIFQNIEVNSFLQWISIFWFIFLSFTVLFLILYRVLGLMWREIYNVK